MRGLSNLGNTCYLNFILQILFHTPTFRETFNHYAESTCHSEHPLHSTAVAFHTLMTTYFKGRGPGTLKQALRKFVASFHQNHEQFGVGQQDGHEYLTFLMRAIHDSMYSEGHLIPDGEAVSRADRLERKAIESHRVDGSSTTEMMLGAAGRASDRTCYDSVIFQLFSGQYRFQTQCRNPDCMYVSDRFETFRCSEVPIGNPKKRNITLDDVLLEYSSVTELDTEYECDKCKVRTNCYRRQTFWRLPKILVINLKRAIHHFDKHTRYRELKDNRMVKIPDTLDMSKYSTAPREHSTYKLYATGNHFGATNGGHYYAQIRDEAGNWTIANDEQIKDDVAPNMEHVCLLFYELEDE
jgi:ubiquitin C-terminal hydrolase